jgi:hypothetical protein
MTGDERLPRDFAPSSVDVRRGGRPDDLVEMPPERVHPGRRTIDFGAQGELAVVAGQMKVELHRSGIGVGIGADQLTLIITLPNGREFHHVTN